MREKHGNLLDILILLLVGFCIFSIVGRFVQMRTGVQAEERAATVLLRIKGTEAQLPLSVEEGEDVFLASGERFGNVKSLTAVPARVTVESEGAVIEGRWEDGSLWDVEVELSIAGTIGENGFLRGGSTAVLAGQSLSLYTRRAYFYGEVSAVHVE